MQISQFLFSFYFHLFFFSFPKGKNRKRRIEEKNSKHVCKNTCKILCREFKLRKSQEELARRSGGLQVHTNANTILGRTDNSFMNSENRESTFRQHLPHCPVTGETQPICCFRKQNKTKKLRSGGWKQSLSASLLLKAMFSYLGQTSQPDLSNHKY